VYLEYLHDDKARGVCGCVCMCVCVFMCVCVCIQDISTMIKHKVCVVIRVCMSVCVCVCERVFRISTR